VLRVTDELAGLAGWAAAEAERLRADARGRLHRAVNDLAALLEATRQIAAQTRQRLAGSTPDGASRRVSKTATPRPIAKGSLGKPVQSGHKGQVTDNDDGIVLDHTLEQGSLADAPQLAPAIAGSSSAPAAGPGPSPLTAATARRPSTTPCTSWACAPS
jgi:transposase, IS5 family